MATQVKTRIKNRIDQKQAWQQTNPVLLCGEIAVETGSYGAKFKVGDGFSQYSDLPYAGGSTVSVDGRPSDLGVLRLAKDEYERRLVAGTLLSNELYVVSSDYVDAYGQQVKNLAPGTDLSDAVNLEQLCDAVSSIQLPTDLSDFTNNSGFLTKTSADVDFQPVGNYLSSNALNNYKTYNATLSSLSADGYATQTWVNQQLSDIETILNSL